MKKKLTQRFQGLYWRQMVITAGMVLLTLFLLGASFFALSYNYAKQQRDGDLQAKAKAVAVFSAGYLAVEAAAKLARHESWTGAASVGFSVVRQETMYSSDNQKLLFPVT